LTAKKTLIKILKAIGFGIQDDKEKQHTTAAFVKAWLDVKHSAANQLCFCSS
jgi:hypothetical protein